jgi:hypothetical protein
MCSPITAHLLEYSGSRQDSAVNMSSRQTSPGGTYIQVFYSMKYKRKKNCYNIITEAFTILGNTALYENSYSKDIKEKLSGIIALKFIRK